MFLAVFFRKFEKNSSDWVWSKTKLKGGVAIRRIIIRWFSAVDYILIMVKFMFKRIWRPGMWPIRHSKNLYFRALPKRNYIFPYFNFLHFRPWNIFITELFFFHETKNNFCSFSELRFGEICHTKNGNKIVWLIALLIGYICWLLSRLYFSTSTFLSDVERKSQFV